MIKFYVKVYVKVLWFDTISTITIDLIRSLGVFSSQTPTAADHSLSFDLSDLHR